jgi:TatD DNase family protein
MYIDSHCHLNLLDLTAYNGSMDQAIEDFRRNHVQQMLCVSVESGRFSELQALADRYVDICISVGIHPNEPIVEDSIQEGLKSEDAFLKVHASHPRVVAIGETGLDYYREETDHTLQRQRFIQHIACARAVGKPLIIHSRKASEDTMALLKQENAQEIAGGRPGVLHCFTESWEMAQAALDLGFYISISGIVTFQNAKSLQAVAVQVPIDRLLVETDAPYLAPVPHRGKPNYPHYVRHVVEKIAALRGIPPEVLAFETNRNFKILFNMGHHSHGT